MIDKLLKAMPLWAATLVVMALAAATLVLACVLAPWSIFVVLGVVAYWVCYIMLSDIKEDL